MADSIKQFSFRMTEDTLFCLKKAALERRTTATELVKKVLSDWWDKQPEGQLFPLFPPEETTTEQSTPKTAPKAAAAKKAATKKPAAKTKAKAR